MELQQRIEKLKEEHGKAYGDRGKLQTAVVPFRICPLGAHVDHQLGPVTGMALENSIILVFSVNPEPAINIRSMNFPGDISLELGGEFKRNFDWGDYARGAAMSLARMYELKRGFDGVVEGDLPVGGLSSSAAVGLAYLMALESANDIRADEADNIELDRIIENDFIEINNGILDQSVILLSRRNTLLYMDCRDGRYERVEPAPHTPPFDVLVVFSGIRKKLIETDYNKRVGECEAATRKLLQMAGRPAPHGVPAKLRHVSPEEFGEHGRFLEEVQRKRAEHFFSESRRVHEGLDAWRKGDLKKLGQLMKESCHSSIYNYECGCPQLITLSGIMNETPGVYGSRFSGAGFRGCCIGFSDPKHRDTIRKNIFEKYTEKHPDFANDLEVHFCTIGNGARFK